LSYRLYLKDGDFVTVELGQHIFCFEWKLRFYFLAPQLKIASVHLST